MSLTASLGVQSSPASSLACAFALTDFASVYDPPQTHWAEGVDAVCQPVAGGRCSLSSLAQLKEGPRRCATTTRRSAVCPHARLPCPDLRVRLVPGRGSGRLTPTFARCSRRKLRGLRHAERAGRRPGRGRDGDQPARRFGRDRPLHRDIRARLRGPPSFDEVFRLLKPGGCS